MVHIMQLKHSPVTVVLEQPVCLLNPCFVLRPLSIIHLWCYLRSPWTGNRGSFSRLPGGARRLRCQYPPQTKGPDRLDPIFLCPHSSQESPVPVPDSTGLLPSLLLVNEGGQSTAGAPSGSRRKVPPPVHLPRLLTERPCPWC
ncbi:hypothetical protein GBAR_LOCUS17258 [Geodia barretti]|uniref:Uncharacterized protein n=1 Tax=Geodia barretti TaxID=519541 RepID=A0AA35SI64_GEOBA|nr:hypothetical protein GBAR_LOCUS17258 [Geodia barretti]